ncbi:MAG: hypothetical protein ABEK75_12820 [Salinibacter sp.]
MTSRLSSPPLLHAPAAIVLFALLLAGCDLTGDTEPQSPNFTVADNLNERITSLDSGNAAATSASAKNFSVEGVIRVAPPTVNGEGTTASYISFNEDGGDRVFVGYKIPGGEFGGGIDVFNAANPDSLTGINSIKSTNLDVQEIADDPDEGAEYVAGALKTNKADASPSVIVKLSFSGNSGNNLTTTHKRLSANVAKGVVNAPAGDSRHDLYVVTDGNALYRYDANLEDELVQTAGSSELSSITAEGGTISMLAKSGALWRSDFGSASAPVQTSLSLDGSGIEDNGIARLTASDHQNRNNGSVFVYAALNEGGFRVLDSDVDAELQRQTAGDYTSVSAPDNGNYLYASAENPSGENVVEVYEYDGNSSPVWGSAPIATINTADFFEGATNAQTNQVLAVGDYLYIANGTDGLVVLEVTSN